MLLQALNRDQQLSRVERWAQKGPADPQVLAELKGFWAEVKKRLAEAHSTMMVLALHKVANAQARVALSIFYPLLNTSCIFVVACSGESPYRCRATTSVWSWLSACHHASRKAKGSSAPGKLARLSR